MMLQPDRNHSYTLLAPLESDVPTSILQNMRSHDLSNALEGKVIFVDSIRRSVKSCWCGGIMHTTGL